MCMLFGCRFLFKFVPAFAQTCWFKTRVRKSPTTSASVTSMAAAGSAPMDVEGSSQEEVSTVQVHWTPNLGCNLRIDLNTGIPEYSNYLRSTSWVPRRALRTVGDGGEVIYAKRRSESSRRTHQCLASRSRLRTFRDIRAPGRCSVLPTWGEGCDGSSGRTVSISVPRQTL